MLPAPGLSILGNPDLRRYVLPTEQVVIATRQHWAALLGPIAIAVASFVLVAVLVTLAPANAQDAVGWLWFGFLAALAYLAFRWLEWRHEWFISTDKRLLLLYGLVIHKVAMMPLAKVTDMGYSRTPAGYLLGYGRFVMESAGQDQALRQIDFVPRPDETYRTLCGELFKPFPQKPADDPAPTATKPSRGRFGIFSRTTDVPADVPAPGTVPGAFVGLPGDVPPPPPPPSVVVVPGRALRDPKRPITEPIPLPYQKD